METVDMAEMAEKVQAVQKAGCQQLGNSTLHVVIVMALAELCSPV